MECGLLSHLMMMMILRKRREEGGCDDVGVMSLSCPVLCSACVVTYSVQTVVN